mmetsp:Transcript_26327/g.49402  ORF Transcript_26327/g.49402 Transcript_26327/m.49402 type:complete len:170 (+) Transcript_26327:70-579(+)
MTTKAEQEILKYDGHYNASRMEGNGTYESAHGGRYIGEFQDGRYHGDGILYVKNGFFKGEWEDGKLSDGKFYFRDDLEVTVGELDSWEYCDGEEDRRFHSEIKAGVPEGEMKYVSANVCPALPEGCYDVDEGYYNPDDKAIFDYKTNDVVRYPENSEAAWIVEHCRKGV